MERQTLDDIDIQAVYQNFMKIRFQLTRHKEGKLWLMCNNVKFEFRQNYPYLRETRIFPKY